jgi:hypothetical protein
MHFPTDRECLERMMPTVGKFDSHEITIGWIRNTLELGLLGLSENVKTEIDKDPSLEILGPACDLEFDGDGNLVGPHFWGTGHDAAKSTGISAGSGGSSRK